MMMENSTLETMAKQEIYREKIKKRHKISDNTTK